MKQFASRFAALTVLLSCSALGAFGHIGDQNVFFEGNAGPYPVRIIIRPPGVIPGLADISIRVATNDVEQVTVLPMRWDSARKGAPRPDEARRVRGETNLFSAELWFMRRGAQSVEVAISGRGSTGTVIVPVNAIATRVLTMSPPLTAVLAGLGVLLLAMAAAIIGAAVRESTLPPGRIPERKRIWFARGAFTISSLLLGLSLAFGKQWWDSEAHDYRRNRLYEPLECKVTVHTKNGVGMLTLERAVSPGRKDGPIVPEHGKLMHLFLVREPGMDSFAHLHPVKRDWKTFDAALPALPSGTYRVYADVTYETGFTETLVGTANLDGPMGQGALDPDDSWTASGEFTSAVMTNRHSLGGGFWMEMSIDASLAPNRETRLRFVVRDGNSRIVKPEFFMGMAGHLILRRDDGSVFTHLHPSGSFSMTAQQLFEMRAEGNAPLKIASSKADPICRLPPFDSAPSRIPAPEEISFPYAFPLAGHYRLWTQVKIGGAIQTGVFDVTVPPENRDRKRIRF
jgi:hypothetical protein